MDVEVAVNECLRRNTESTQLCLCGQQCINVFTVVNMESDKCGLYIIKRKLWASSGLHRAGQPRQWSAIRSDRLSIYLAYNTAEYSVHL